MKRLADQINGPFTMEDGLPVRGAHLMKIGNVRNITARAAITRPTVVYR